MSMILDKKGFSMVEMLVTLAIFSIVLSAISVAYVAQTRHLSREYTLGGSEVELEIAKDIIVRDMSMAGYGLADNYDFDNNGVQNFSPRSVGAQDNNPDTLTLMGTAIGIGPRDAQHWTFMVTNAPTFKVWNDVREDAATNDRVILVEPTTKTLLAQGADWRFTYQNSISNVNSFPSGTPLGTLTVGTLIYGIDPGAGAGQQPYAAVRYSLGGPIPSNCAAGTFNLLRAESWATNAPAGGNPLLACVRDMQVAFGLDADEDGDIELWDNGGGQVAGYTIDQIKRRVKQTRMYLLVQSGNRDPGYTYPQATVRVGDASLGIGADVALTAGQRNYRWRLVSFNVTPRNLR